MSKKIDGVVFLCFDPREEANLWKNVKGELILPSQRFHPVGQLGTAVVLAMPAYFPVKFAAIMEDTRFALEEFARGNFILIGHDCGIYKLLKTQKPTTLIQKVQDTISGAKCLQEHFPNIPISVWFKKTFSLEDEVLNKYNRLPSTRSFQQIYTSR